MMVYVLLDWQQLEVGEKGLVRTKDLSAASTRVTLGHLSPWCWLLSENKRG